MKKRWKVLLVLSLLFIIGTTIKCPNKAEAADPTYDELKITEVNDIDVYNYYYEINNINVNNAIYPNYERKVFKFTIDEDGFVKLIITANNLTKTVTKASTSGGSTTSQIPNISATIYRDDKLIFPVVPTVTAKGGVNGETKEKVALDRGTYYIELRTDSYQPIASNTSFTHVNGQSELILYYQSVESDEIFRPSSVGMENPIESEEAFGGLLTVANPRDYYSFMIKERSLVKIKYMYESQKKAKFTLYGEDRGVLITKQFNGNNQWTQDELLLDKGTYYCSLETLTTGDGGRTNIEITSTPYKLELSQKGTTKNSYITVDTIEVPKEVRYLGGKLTQEDINNSKWKTAPDITEELQFGVNKAGNYSVRVVDDKGNMFIETINVKKCDNTAPSKPKITGYGEGEYEVTGTAEKDSVVIVLYGNREYKCTASSKGNYSCVINARLSKGAKVEVYAQDRSGNVSTSAVVTVK